MGKFTVGDYVILDHCHESFDSELKKNKGRKGRVDAIGDCGRYHVKFQGQTNKIGNCHLVAGMYLEPANSMF